MLTGKIKWFNPKIGAGFIRGDDGENVFFRFNAFHGADPVALRNGQHVRFDIARNMRGLSLTAATVTADAGPF